MEMDSSDDDSLSLSQSMELERRERHAWLRGRVEDPGNENLEPIPRSPERRLKVKHVTKLETIQVKRGDVKTKQEQWRRRISPDLEERLKFFRSTYGFIQPYNILLDKSFVMSLILNNITEDFLDDYFETCMAVTCNLFISECSMKFLRGLPHGSKSEEMRLIEGLATKLKVISCVCEKDEYQFSSVTGCTMEALDRANQFRCTLVFPKKNPPTQPPFIIASQVADHILKFREQIGVPVLYIHERMLHIDAISERNLEWSKASVEAKERKARTAIMMAKNAREDDTDDDEGDDKGTRVDVLPKQPPRKRELSPDICDLPGLTKTVKKKLVPIKLPIDFAQYKTIINSNHKMLFGEQGIKPRKKAKSTMSPILAKLNEDVLRRSERKVHNLFKLPDSEEDEWSFEIVTD